VTVYGTSQASLDFTISGLFELIYKLEKAVIHLDKRHINRQFIQSAYSVLSELCIHSNINIVFKSQKGVIEMEAAEKHLHHAVHSIYKNGLFKVFKC
jgi:hypothetical protein